MTDILSRYEYTHIESISRSIEEMNKKFPSVVQLIEEKKSALFEEFQASVELEMAKAELCSEEGNMVEERRNEAYEKKLAELVTKV